MGSIGFRMQEKIKRDCSAICYTLLNKLLTKKDWCVVGFELWSMTVQMVLSLFIIFTFMLLEEGKWLGLQDEKFFV